LTYSSWKTELRRTAIKTYSKRFAVMGGWDRGTGEAGDGVDGTKPI
jgi:hypothetical protein